MCLLLVSCQIQPEEIIGRQANITPSKLNPSILASSTPDYTYKIVITDIKGAGLHKVDTTYGYYISWNWGAAYDSLDTVVIFQANFGHRFLKPINNTIIFKLDTMPINRKIQVPHLYVDDFNHTKRYYITVTPYNRKAPYGTGPKWDSTTNKANIYLYRNDSLLTKEAVYSNSAPIANNWQYRPDSLNVFRHIGKRGFNY